MVHVGSHQQRPSDHLAITDAGIFHLLQSGNTPSANAKALPSVPLCHLDTHNLLVVSNLFCRAASAILFRFQSLGYLRYPFATSFCCAWTRPKVQDLFQESSFTTHCLPHRCLTNTETLALSGASHRFSSSRSRHSMSSPSLLLFPFR